MVQDVENLCAELNIEPLRNPFDVVVLEYREVQFGDAWTNQDIPTCIATEVVAKWKLGLDGGLCWIARLDARGVGIAVRIPEIHVGRGGNREALGLDVIVGVSGIRERFAPRAAEAVREGPIIAAVC